MARASQSLGGGSAFALPRACFFGGGVDGA
jgi:hypothetical protein